MPYNNGFNTDAITRRFFGLYKFVHVLAQVKPSR